MTLRQQLYGLCMIFLVPMATLAWLLGSQALDQIAFSKKERDGISYLAQIVPIMSKRTLGEDIPSLDGLNAASTRYDKAMLSWEQSTQFRIALTTKATRTQTADSGTKLITAIGDGSNLILDPDLDSYYIMDIAVIHLPGLTRSLAHVEQTLLADPVLEMAASRDQLKLLKGEIDSLREGLTTSMYAAVRNNESGFVSREILGDYGELAAQFDRYGALLTRIASAETGSAELAEARTAFLKRQPLLISNVGKANMGYLRVLDQLLAKRIARKYSALLISLLLAAFSASIAIWLALKVSRRIAHNVSALSHRIDKMAEGDLASAIPLQDQHDEIGKIARALTVFRKQAQHNAELSSALEAEREASSKALEKLAYYDDLTELPNRKFLNSRLDDAISVSTSPPLSALIYFDLDGFKEVNDTMSHLAGDDLLKEVARRLQSYVGPDDLIARLGGDEFAILLKVAPERGAVEELCLAILDRLSQPYQIFNSQQFLSASAGVALLPLTAPRDGIELIRRADVSMYRAKAMGKNRVVFFDPSFDDEALYRKTIESALREALARGEVKLHFQPQFDVSTGRLVSAEGLARWTSARHGEVSPTVFIPIAEQSGLIYDLGMQVLRKAIAAAQRWPDLRISINLSVAQLRHNRFVDDVRDIIAETKAPLTRIELEVTESVIMDDDPTIAEKLATLRKMGFELALDDFGTGYSSLGYLSRYQFDRLKIDRGFIRGASESERGAALLQSIARMGLALGMDVCAEGVETYEDVRTTTEAGCTLLQGFYFSPAVSSMDIDMMISSKSSANIIKKDIHPANSGVQKAA
jgi:diguanylate cyclase (GGDEF)-like protein